MEIWKSLQHPDISNGFLISSIGRFRHKSTPEEKMLESCYHSSNGYDFIPLLLKVGNSRFLELNLRYFPIDDLVAITFVECPDELIGKPVKVEHIDGNLRNNHCENLRWVEDIEEWRDIKDFGNYKISNFGNILSLRNNLILKPTLSRKGYCRITLCDNGFEKSVSIHRIVMETFSPITDMNKYCVNHINEIKTDNYLKNLEWMSLLENNSFGSRTAQTQKPVICIETGVIYKSIKDASEKTGVCLTSIGCCCNKTCGRITAGGFHWRFYEDNPELAQFE